MADDPAKDVSDAELAALRVLWERGTATRRQIADVLYPGGGPSHYTTVQKLLERLEEKGYVTSARDGAQRTFTAAVARDQLIRRRLREVVDQLCDGSLTPLLMNLAKAGPLSAGEIEELKILVRQLSPPDSRKRSR